MQPYQPEGAVAVIGMAGRFPGASDVSGFWRNLLAGVESISFFAAEDLIASGEPEALVRSGRYVPARGVLDEADHFDAEFFGLGDSEAELTDLQHRLLLETAWRAFEDAGYVPGPDPRTGLFVGARENRFAELAARSPRHGADRASLLRLKLGCDSDFMATRIAYRFNLRGPCLTVQTACSSSLVAVHLAARALLTGDCDLALAGGVSVRVPLRQGYVWEGGLIDSVDGHCRAFDDDASGTVGGDGVGLVALRRMADAVRDGDAIHAVILGSAVNNDGSDKIGFTAPSVRGQVDLMRAGLAAAGVGPGAIGFVECHGTGTKLGDPIELRALHDMFGAGSPGTCLIGSVKSNVGHLDAAAGVAGLIKAVLAVRHGVIPPSLHVRTPNRAFTWSGSRLRVSQASTTWPAGPRPRTAAVSSLGLGGTNAFVVVQEPAVASGEPVPTSRWYALPLSATSADALDRMATDLAAELAERPDLRAADVAFTLGAGRREFPYRRVVTCRTVAEAPARLRRPDRATRRPAQRRVRCVFLFPGHGADVRGAGRLHAADAAFAEALDRVATLVAERAGWDPRQVVCGGPGGDEPSTAVVQVCLFALGYAYATAAQEWGVEPDLVIGHSVGEVAAACVAGILTLPDAVALVVDRAEACERDAAAGAMLAVLLPEELLAARAAQSGCTVSAINSPSQCVVSGPVEAVARLAAALRADRVACMRVPARRAFHSPAMRVAAEAITGTTMALRPRPARIPVVSTVTGTHHGDPLAAADYWQRQLVAPVRFDAALRAASGPATCYLDLGPGQLLRRLAAAQIRRDGGAGLATALYPGAGGDVEEAFVAALGALWTAGVPVRWSRNRAGAIRVSLPGHPMDRRRFPVPAPAVDVPAALPEPPAEPAAGPAGESTVENSSAEAVTVVAAVFEELIGVPVTDPEESFLVLGGDSLMAVQAVARISDALGVDLSIEEFLSHPSPQQLADLLAQPTG